MVARDVKDALTTGRAAPGTVIELQGLLGVARATELKRSTSPATGRRDVSALAARPRKATDPARGGAKKGAVVAIPDDAPKPLSPREKYALATETVNTGLKILTDAARSHSLSTTNAQGTATSTPTSASREALQPRSGNITPGRQPRASQKSPHAPTPERPSKTASEVPSHIVATSECTRMAFAFLRSTDTNKLGVREIPKLQLETGMLALIGKLIVFRMDDLAVKELRHVKRSLETLYCRKRVAESASIKRRTGATQPERETLASMLNLAAEFTDDRDALNLATTYYMHVLKLISLLRKPAVIEEMAQYLAVERPNSPADLMCRLAQGDGQTAKAAKQLDGLSQTIAALCPGPSSGCDVAATNRRMHASPATVLKLQTIALRVRRLWWPLAKHQSDLDKELLEPFFRFVTAFTRRSAGLLEVDAQYQRTVEAVESLGLLEPSSMLYNIHSLLFQQAKRASRTEEALHWVSALENDCTALERSHARRLAVTLRRATLGFQSSIKANGLPELEEIVEGLQSKLTGTAADFDTLLSTLHELAVAVSSTELLAACDPSVLRKTLVLAAGFALRYARSYPKRGTQHVMAVVSGALRVSKTTEDLLSWITADAATVFIHAGTLAKVADEANKGPLARAWSISSDAVSLGRVCRAVLLQSVRSSTAARPSTLIDDESLPSSERGALLEMQMDSAFQLASKPKYHPALSPLISDVLRMLATVYTAEEFPIRRTRVATAVFRSREMYSDLLPPHVSARWHDDFELRSEELGHDAGLETYLGDVKTAIAVSKAFSNGDPTANELRSAVSAWSLIVQDCTDAAQCQNKIAELSELVQQLRMISSYFGMLGDSTSQLPVLQLLEKVEKLTEHDDSAQQASAAIEQAKCYLDLDHPEKAGKMLARADRGNEPDLRLVQYQLACAQCSLATDDLKGCKASLAEAKNAREQITLDAVSKGQRRAFELLHATSWLVYSRYSLQSGSPHEALAAAKRSVKTLNSMWSALEHAQGSPKPGAADISDAEGSHVGMNSLTDGVSKLQLTSTGGSHDKTEDRHTRKGAVFWSLVPELTKALMHLSDMYCHHGLFSEANYYCERAVTIAEQVGSSVLLSRTRSHRARLLTLAGRLEEAELCLTRDDPGDARDPCLSTIEQLRALAGLRAKEGSLEKALEVLLKAQQMLETLSLGELSASPEGFGGCDKLAERTVATTFVDRKPILGARKPAKAPPKKAASRLTAVKPASRGAQRPEPPGTTKNESIGPGRYSELRADIALQVITLRLKLGQDIGDALTQLMKITSSASSARKRQVVEYLDLMTQAHAALGMDVTMNILVESTLSLPSLAPPEASASTEKAISTGKAQCASSRAKATAKPKKPAKQPLPLEDSPVVTILQQARDCLRKYSMDERQLHSTVQTHLQGSMQSYASMLLSALSEQTKAAVVCPVEEALAIDHPRMRAMQYEQHAGNVDRIYSDSSEPLSWPKDPETLDEEATSATNFQQDYIDIIPRSWTAVSVCLNEDASELYVARYRSGEQPLILRLPFSRHKPDGVDEEAFDYHRGKAELQEIIELSNYTCHSSRNLDAKGAKSTWWSDREALDRRMHELLINMESIWFGGFKSIFASDGPVQELLARFRRSFEDILDRHLPSRQAAKGRVKGLALHDKVLELFLNLGHDQDDAVDLDEPLADLLYFAVDMLQFSGERNAYDEIDFDEMAVDVLDALRSCHEAFEDHGKTNAHLVLVLDRRLQAFPWENMPCLQDKSVSRVGSMLSLRECIIAMRAARSMAVDKLSSDDEGCHVVERTPGTYILNPSSDLAATQTMLSPPLSTLKDSAGQPWSSIVNEAPDEARFSSALTTSSMLLYFGHGAGSQYIRPRAIKRLEQCSEVVWLMGCSSGAVTEYGDLEPFAVPLAYLLAGSKGRAHERREKGGKCMAVVATLWDVTDKDIDRFSLRMGEAWGLWPACEQSRLPTKTPKKRPARRIIAPSTPQQAAKTPKTPKVHKTPAAAKTPARSEGRVDREDGQKSSLVEAVARSRDACYLRYLNGAAPVVYGVPVYLGD